MRYCEACNQSIPSIKGVPTPSTCAECNVLDGYERYARGLRLLDSVVSSAGEHIDGQALDALSLDDMLLARETLQSLEASARVAGSNTWQKANERYRKAVSRYQALCARVSL